MIRLLFQRVVFVCTLSALVLSGGGIVFAQEQDAPPPLDEDVFIDINADDFDPSELIPIRDEPYTEVQGDVANSFYGIIYYDIYERAYQVDDFFPLGYSAIVEYEYFPVLYERERGWEPVVSRETGSFRRGEREIASYEKTFDTTGQEISATREGFSVMIPIMQLLGTLLGIDFRADER